MFSQAYTLLSQEADQQGAEVIAHIERVEYRADQSVTGHCILMESNTRFRFTGFTVRPQEGYAEFFGGHHGITESQAWMLLGKRVTDQKVIAADHELRLAEDGAAQR